MSTPTEEEANRLGAPQRGSLVSRVGKQLGMLSSVGSSFAVFGLHAIHAILLARLLGPTGRGEYGTAMFYTQTMIYIGLAGSLYSIARFAAKPDSRVGSLRGTAVKVGLLTGTASMAIAIGLSLIAVPSDKRYLLPMCVICSLMLPIEHVRLTSLAVDHGRGQFTRYNISRVFSAAVFPVIVAVFYATETKSLSLIAAMTVLSPTIGLAFYFAIFGSKKTTFSGPPSSREVLRDGRSDGLAVLASDLFDRLGNFWLLWLVSLEDYGFYVTALPAASLLLVAPHTFALYSFRAANTQSLLSVSKLLRYAGLVMLFQLIALAIMLLALDPLLAILFGDAFNGISAVAQILLVAMAANGSALVGDGFLRGRGKAHYGIWSRSMAAAAMAAATVCLPIGDALQRVAVAMTIGYGVNAIITLLCCIKECATGDSTKQAS